MLINATEFRRNISRVFNLVDSGEEVTIIKKDSGNQYRLVALAEDVNRDIEIVAKQMSRIKIDTSSLEK